MLTFAALPKPFQGHIGVIQRNAVRSWLKLDPKPTVILLGDEEGTAEAAREFGCLHQPTIARNAFGTPLLDDAFLNVEAMTGDPYINYINCDILLFQDFIEGFKRVRRRFEKFLLVGWCTNLWVRENIDFQNPHWQTDLQGKLRAEGRLRGNTSDYFVYRKGMYPHYPPLTLGRAYFDTWVITEARRLKIPVVNATEAITAIHQNHLYTAAPGETSERHNGIEAQRNLDIIGAKELVYRPTEATHLLTPSGLRRTLYGSLLIGPWKEWVRRRTVGRVKRWAVSMLRAVRSVRRK